MKRKGEILLAVRGTTLHGVALTLVRDKCKLGGVGVMLQG